jgi:MFS family permease
VSGSVLAAAAPSAMRVKGGCWLLAAIFGLFLVASTAPSPLYGVYAARFHFSPVTITTVFAVYALALLTTLLFTGSLADVIGRRPVIFGALGLELVSVAFFLAGPGSPPSLLPRTTAEDHTAAPGHLAKLLVRGPSRRAAPNPFPQPGGPCQAGRIVPSRR